MSLVGTFSTWPVLLTISVLWGDSGLRGDIAETTRMTPSGHRSADVLVLDSVVYGGRYRQEVIAEASYQGPEYGQRRSTKDCKIEFVEMRTGRERVFLPGKWFAL